MVILPEITKINPKSLISYEKIDIYSKNQLDTIQRDILNTGFGCSI